MATAERTVAEQRIVMQKISWKTYQTLLDERGDGRYQLVEDSVNLPVFPVKDVADWTARAETTDETTWARTFRSWIRERGESNDH